MKARFYKFLVKEGVLFLFIDNLNCHGKYKDLTTLCSKINNGNHIKLAFPWKRTKEGVDFWNKLNAKWKKQIRK